MSRHCQARRHCRPSVEKLEDRTLPSTSFPLNPTSWTSIGPLQVSIGLIDPGNFGVSSGRVTGLAVHPTDANVIYAATAGGGVWKTTNGGTSWAPLTDNQASLFMGAIALAPSNPNIIYAGTGEANNGPSKLMLNRENIFYGRGVLKSTDAGQTWTLLGNAHFNRRTISTIVVHPTDPNIVYVAVGAVAVNGLPGNTGVWKSTDGGQNWTQTLSVPSFTGAQAVSGLIRDPGDPTHQTLYCAVGDPYGSTANGVYKTTNGGMNWNLAGDFPTGAQDSTIGRIAIAISPSSPSTLFAAIARSPVNGGVGIFYKMLKTTNSGGNWNPLQNVPSYMGNLTQFGVPIGFGDYNTALAVDPANANIVYAGGETEIIQSTDGGNSWNEIQNGTNSFGVHPDHHAFVFDAGGRLLDGNDGGVFRLQNAAPSSILWANLNTNLGTLQTVSVGLDPLNPNIMYGGFQDNSTNIFNDSPFWYSLDDDDGGLVVTDPFDPNIIFFENEWLNGSSLPNVNPTVLERTTNGFLPAAIYVMNGINPTDPANFFPPYEADPVQAGRYLFATNRVYETTNYADNWSPISTPNTAGWTTSAFITAVAAAPNDVNTVYAAAGGFVYVTTNHGQTWTQTGPVANPTSELRYRAIAVDPTNAQVAYVVAGNFGDITAGGHIWRTTNAGATWIDISGNLPDSPAWSLILDKRRPGLASDVLYVGNDEGVYFSRNLGASWTPFGQSLPHTQATDMALNTNLGILAVGTFGRGVFQIEPPGTVQIIATGADAGGGPNVAVFDARTSQQELSFMAYDSQFTGGVRVAVGDVSGDGYPDIITAPGPGGGPDIHVYNGINGNLLKQFFAFDPAFTGGSYVATGDINDDGFDDIIIGADAGGGPNVIVYSGKDGSILRNFFAYDSQFTGGVRVAAGDIDADHAADIVCGAGPGGGPNVTVVSGANGAILASFFAFAANFNAGIYVASADLNCEGHADIIAGAGKGGGPNVIAFEGGNLSIMLNFFAFDPAFLGGVRVGAAEANNDGMPDIVAGAGPGAGPAVRTFSGLTGTLLDQFFAYDPSFTSGIFVGGSGR